MTSKGRLAEFIHSSQRKEAERKERKRIAPIETSYGGCRFRSRLEARWAVFFDSLRIPWQYEPEGYVVDHVPYLVDFYLPEHQLYLEMKPAFFDDCGDFVYPDKDVLHKVAWVAETNGRRGAVICGVPGYESSGGNITPYGPYQGFAADCWFYWCECPNCGSIGFHYQGNWGQNAHSPGCDRDRVRKWFPDCSPRLAAAYDAAKSARFEHRGQVKQGNRKTESERIQEEISRYRIEHNIVCDNS